MRAVLLPAALALLCADASAGRVGRSKFNGRPGHQFSARGLLARVTGGRHGHFLRLNQTRSRAQIVRKGRFAPAPTIQRSQRGLTVRHLKRNLHARKRPDGTLDLWQFHQISGRYSALEALDLAGGKTLLSTHEERHRGFGGMLTIGFHESMSSAELMAVFNGRKGPRVDHLTFSDTRVEMKFGGLTLRGRLANGHWTFRASRRLGWTQSFTTRDHFKIQNETRF